MDQAPYRRRSGADRYWSQGTTGRVAQRGALDRNSSGMKAEFQSQFQEALREVEMEDLKKHAEDLNDAARSVTHPYPDEKKTETKYVRD